MAEADRYWMVHNPINRDPQVKHLTKSSAETEASRLASKHIGETFFVLEAINAFQVEIPGPSRVYLFNPVVPGAETEDTF